MPQGGLDGYQEGRIPSEVKVRLPLVSQLVVDELEADLPIPFFSFLFPSQSWREWVPAERLIR